MPEVAPPQSFQTRPPLAGPAGATPEAHASQIEMKPAPGADGARAASQRLIWAVIPCFNRPADLALVLEDLTAIDLTCRPAMSGGSLDPAHAGPPAGVLAPGREPPTGVGGAINGGASANEPSASADGSTPGWRRPAGRGADSASTVPARVRLKIVVVDNASATPLSAMRVPDGLDVTFLRLKTNTGGAGGYNAGMAYAIAQGRKDGAPAEFVWLVDSDVRIEPGALRGLIDCLDDRPDAVAAGSAIADMQDGSIFEVGGRVERIFGQFGPRFGGDSMPKAPVIECTYTAACSALVRREAIEATGLFPEVFLNADDVEWFIRMASVTGKKVLATTDSVIRHPFFGRYATLPRYYMSRNCFGPLEALGLGWRVRLFRALRDVPRAVAQVMVGRDDLAALHLKGMEHAAQRLQGAAPPGTIEFERPRAFETLGETLRPMLAELQSPPRKQGPKTDGPTTTAERSPRTVYVHKRVILPVAKADELHRQLASLGLTAARIQRGNFHVEQERMFHGICRALWRLFVAGPTADVAIIHARGRPMAWCRGRIQILVSQDGYVVRRLSRRAALAGAWRTFWKGVLLSFKVAGRKPPPADANPLPSADEVAARLPSMVA